jgi:hypothetical protein
VSEHPVGPDEDPAVSGEKAAASGDDPADHRETAAPSGDADGTAEPTQTLDEIRAAWRAERAAADPSWRPVADAAADPASGEPGGPEGDFSGRPIAPENDAAYRDPPTRPHVPFGFGTSVGEKWGARKVLYIVVAITLVAAIIRPALASVAILAGVAYWTADKLLAPGGRAAEAPEGSGFRKAHEMWRDIGILGRIVAAVVLGVLLGLLTGTLGG